MSITKALFGKMPSGEDVFNYTIDNANGLSVEILSLGGIIKNIYVNDKNGNKTDVVCGHNTVDEYLTLPGYMGAAIGRNSNRIKGCKFEINGKEYKVADNNKGNNLHGGIVGFDKKIWDVIEQDGDEPSIVMTLTSPDGEEGFPGNLDVTMSYTLTKDNALEIHYIAKSDADTVVNMTNHSYFNLAGHNGGDIYEHLLMMNSDFYTPNDATCAPTGEVLSVKNTPFDFTTEKPLGPALKSDYPQVADFDGIDHNFAIRGTGLRLFSTLYCPDTGIAMDTISDLPGVQIYAGNCLKGDSGKDGAVYEKHNAICLETQYFPNALEMTHFPSPILKKGNEYNTKTIYKFTTR